MILCLVALAIGTAGTSTARATPLFQADSYPASIDGGGKGTRTTFWFNGAAWECGTSIFKGELTGAASALTLAPTYEECRWNYPPVNPPAWSTVKVLMNGCDYRLHSLEKTAADAYSSLMDLQCPPGQQMVVELNSGPWTICRLTVSAQAGKTSVPITDNTGKEGGLDDVGAKLHAQGLKYTQDLPGSPIACPIKPGTYEFLDVKQEFPTTLTATSEPGKQIGFRVNGE
ncbi:MAG TPA: hypothetical protein VJU14_08340 [Solirubrobacterales bacterium]|nr:hypothetical protein [Solirubrobacterales bacterium]